MARVQWDEAAFRAAQVVGRDGGVMELRASDDQPSEDVLRAFAAAVDEANEELASQESSGRELYCLVSAVTPGPRGPVAIVTECEPVAALRLHLTTLAASLERRGVSGRLVPLPPAEIDRWFGNNSFAALTLVAEPELDRHGLMSTTDARGKPEKRWWGDPAATTAVLDLLVAWVLEAGRRIDLSVGFTAVPVQRAEVREQVSRGLAATGRVYLQVDDGPTRMRRLVTSPYGDLLVHDFDPGADAMGRLETMVELLVAASPHLRAGWIQQGATSIDDRHQLMSLVEPTHLLAERTATTAWRLLPLEDEHVYDARVVQLLTEQQMARTRELDPSRWTTRPLGHGRYLLRHARPELWIDRGPSYEPLPIPPRHTDPLVRCPVPDDVLTDARRDLSAVLLTAGGYDAPG